MRAPAASRRTCCTLTGPARAPNAPGFRGSKVPVPTPQYIPSSPGTGIFICVYQHLLRGTGLSQSPRSTSCLYTLIFFKELQNFILLLIHSHTDVALRDSLAAPKQLSQHPALQKTGGEFVFQSWPRVHARWQCLIEMQCSAYEDYIPGICLYFCLPLLYKFRKPAEILTRFTINRCYIALYHQTGNPLSPDDTRPCFSSFHRRFSGLVSHCIYSGSAISHILGHTTAPARHQPTALAPSTTGGHDNKANSSHLLLCTSPPPNPRLPFRPPVS